MSPDKREQSEKLEEEMSVKEENRDNKESVDEERSEHNKEGGTHEKRKYIRQATKIKLQNVKKDLTGVMLTPEEKLALALESASKFNDRVHINKIKLKHRIKEVSQR